MLNRGVVTKATARGGVALAAFFVAASTGQAQDTVPWPRADRLTITLRVQLLSTGADSVRLAYQILNDGASEQSAMTFVVRSLAPAYRVAAPSLWWGSATVMQDSSVAHWFAVDRHALIAPGATLAGFSLGATGLTEPVAYRVQGFHEPPPVEEGTAVEDPPSFWVNSVSGVTVGVAPFPQDSTPPAVLNRLRSLTDRACDLGWVSVAECSGLRADVDSASAALNRGDTQVAGSFVQAFLDRLGGVGDDGRALLEPNARFAQRQIQPAGTPTTLALSVAADTYIRAGNPNQNQGTESILRVRPDGDNRVLVRVDDAALAQAAAARSVTSARLELTISRNFDNWGPSGRTVDVHRVTQVWTELGATWNCGDDLEVGDPNPDCPLTAWSMSGPEPRPWVTPPTATVSITNGLRGTVSLDVTADVVAFLSGQASNFGWVIKRTDEGPSGAVDFGSRESATPPRLVLTVQ